MVAKLVDLQTWILANSLHVVSVVETWLHDGIPDSAIVPKGYILFRKDRPSRGGGVCVMASTALRPERIMPDPGFQDLEVLFVDLHLRGRVPLRLATIYCSTRFTADSTYISRIGECIESMANSAGNMIITGDFNRPGIKWISWDRITCSSSIDSMFRDFMGDLGFTQLATFPTRGANYLSLVFCRPLSEICAIEPLPPFNNSDSPPHLPLFYSIQAGSEGSSPNIRVRNYSAIDYEWASSLMDRPASLPNDTTENLYHAFYETINTIICSAPLLRRYKHRPPAWDLAKIKKRAWRIYRAFPTQHNRSLYEAISRSYCEAVESLRSELLRNLCDPSNRRAFYQHLSTTGGHSAFTVLRHADGTLCQSDSERAQVFLQVFDGAYRQDDSIDFSKFSIPGPTTTFNDLFAPEAIFKIISTLKTCSAAGPDGIPAILLKNMGLQIAPQLSSLFLHFFHDGWIPPIWQLATIVPVYKGKGSASRAENYRPIALTSILSKIYEKCILKFLLPFLSTTGIIPPSQFGGIPGRSSTLQLVHCYDHWTTLQDSGSPFDVFFLDITKAFDRVPRSRLASSLCNMGIPHIVVRAIMTLFNRRHHQVRVGSTLSVTSSTTSGVIQGTVLGCVLFILYTAPLSQLIRPGILYTFIDDIKWTTETNHEANAQTSLCKIVAWLVNHGLELSPSKSQVLHCGRLNPALPYSINRETIETCSTHSDLGVIISHDLGFRPHIESIVLKAKRTLFAVLTHYKGCDHTSLTMAFSTFVRPILEYASPVWSPSYIFMVEYVERVQRIFTRKLFASSYTPYNVRCAQLSLHSLEWRRLTLDLCLMYRILSDDNPVYLPPLICPVLLRPLSITRGHQRRVTVHHARGNVKKHSFFIRTAILWNALPNDIVNSPSLQSFKTRLKTFDLSPYCQCFPF